MSRKRKCSRGFSKRLKRCRKKPGVKKGSKRKSTVKRVSKRKSAIKKNHEVVDMLEWKDMEIAELHALKESCERKSRELERRIHELTNRRGVNVGVGDGVIREMRNALVGTPLERRNVNVGSPLVRANVGVGDGMIREMRSALVGTPRNMSVTSPLPIPTESNIEEKDSSSGFSSPKKLPSAVLNNVLVRAREENETKPDLARLENMNLDGTPVQRHVSPPVSVSSPSLGVPLIQRIQPPALARAASSSLGGRNRVPTEASVASLGAQIPAAQASLASSRSATSLGSRHSVASLGAQIPPQAAAAQASLASSRSVASLGEAIPAQKRRTSGSLQSNVSKTISRSSTVRASSSSSVSGSQPNLVNPKECKNVRKSLRDKILQH